MAAKGLLFHLVHPCTACSGPAAGILSYLHPICMHLWTLPDCWHVIVHLHASTVQVLMVDMEESAIVVKGSIPGKPGGAR